MKKPLLIAFFVLTACAFGVYASLYVPAYLQEKKHYETKRTYALRAIAPEIKKADNYVAKLRQKADELDRKGIKGEERRRLLGLESRRLRDEINQHTAPPVSAN